MNSFTPPAQQQRWRQGLSYGIVIVGAFALYWLYVTPQALAEERKPDASGHYHLTIPKLIISDSEREVEVWGSSCDDLRVRIQWSKKNPPSENPLFCLPYVDNVMNFIKYGIIEPPLGGFIQFKSGPILDISPNFPDKAQLDKQQKISRDRVLRVYGKLPPENAQWVQSNDQEGGYIEVKAFVSCPSDHPRANFCVVIKNYYRLLYDAPTTEIYGVYCWKDCASLRLSPQNFQKAILFGDVIFYLNGAYAQPLEYLRTTAIEKILLLDQSEEGTTQ